MNGRMLAPVMAGCLVLAVAVAGVREPGSGAAAAEWSTASDMQPGYTSDGQLKFPANYREWVFLSSGLDMSYSESRDTSGHSMFDNVFAEPTAYREFVRTGTWPDGAALVLESRGAMQKGSINRRGKFQSGELMGVEVHIKDTKRFQGGWGFFSFQGTGPATMLPLSESCYSCHQQHGAVDTTFVQFYPTLLSIAATKGTLSPGFRP